jgi:hypothetical protein
MPEDVIPAGEGPFSVGERVHVRALQADGTVIAVGETATVRVYAGSGPGELRAVTAYVIRLDNGIERSVMDRDGHISRLQ